MQNDDGGFPYWRHGDQSDPFNSIQSTQALLLAERYGYAGSADAASQSCDQPRAALPARHGRQAARERAPQTRDTLDAYALAVRALAKDPASSAADAMVTSRAAALPMDAVAWLLPVVSAPQRRRC